MKANRMINLRTAYFEKDSMNRIAKTAYKQLATTKTHSENPTIN